MSQISSTDPQYLNTLFKKKSLTPILIPLILILLFAGAGIWAWFQYVNPTYVEEEKAVAEDIQLLQSFQGSTIDTKTIEDDCFSLKLLDAEKRTYTTVCVPEEVWNANQEGKEYVYVPISAEPKP